MQLTGTTHAIDDLDRHRLFRVFAESIPHLAWIADADGFIYWYNQRWYSYTGTTSEEMEGWGWQSVHDPSHLPLVMERWKASIDSGQPFEMTFPLRGADGTFRPFLTRVAPFSNDDGLVLQWFGTNTDISSELEFAAALAASEERFRTAAAAVSALLWTNDAEGRMHGDQAAWSAFTGQTPDQYEDYGWASALHPEDRQPTIEAWQAAVATGSLFAFEHRVRRHDGIYRLFSVRALPIRNSDGSVREWVGVHTDITEEREIQRQLAETIVQQKLASEALVRSEKLAVAGRLAASIAHEINNPLEAVTNLIYLMLQGELSEEQRGFATMMQSEVARVSHIATHTLRFHRQSTSPVQTAAEVLFESVLALHSGRIRNADVRTSLELHAEHAPLAYDGEIRQVLANLVGNAVEAMQDQPLPRTLTVRSRDHIDPKSGEPGVLFTVADTGRGMSPETRARLFEPFFTTRAGVGTGLGLWISSEIVAKHHGTLRVRSSQHPAHRGTVFQLFIPLRHPPAEHESLTPVVAASLAC